MKVKVTKEFRDKHSGEVYKPGKVLYISKTRYEEILKTAPLVEEIKEVKEETKKAKNTAE